VEVRRCMSGGGSGPEYPSDCTRTSQWVSTTPIPVIGPCGTENTDTHEREVVPTFAASFFFFNREPRKCPRSSAVSVGCYVEEDSS
jgi:hypothetical protein